MKKIVSIILACLVLACVICAAGCTMTSYSTTTTTQTDADGTVHSVTDSTKTVNGETTHSTTETVNGSTIHSTTEVVSSGDVTKDVYEDNGVFLNVLNVSRSDDGRAVVLYKITNTRSTATPAFITETTVYNDKNEVIGKFVTDNEPLAAGADMDVTTTLAIFDPYTINDVTRAFVKISAEK